jgi:hypothetical protein
MFERRLRIRPGTSSIKMRAILLRYPLVVVAVAGCAFSQMPADEGGTPTFRVRSEFSAALNADAGWAGGLNEPAAVQADRPFRIRFEMEASAGTSSVAGFRLQGRRNGGEWTDLEAHDFPYPVRELDLDFEASEIGARPAGWSFAPESAAGIAVAADGQKRILRVPAADGSVTGLFSARWPVTEFAAEFRLLPGDRGVGLVFGHADAANHGRVFVDPAAGAVRVSRIVDGSETLVAERRAEIVPGEWTTLEVETNGSEVEVNYGDDAVEFTADLGAAIPPSAAGFIVPAGATVEFREFGFAGEARTPRASIVSCPAYEDGSSTSDLLKGSPAAFRAGAGVSLADRTGVWSGAGAHGEFEWALVVRRYADGAVTNEEGDTFEFRMVGDDGIARGRTASVRVAIPPGHVGGTFVETPGRIGPWQAANGDLYFIMEPTETDNVFMMIKSTDNGRTWREVDAANRPATNDLEAVDGRQVGDTIHIIHQVTGSLRYHAFRTSDHPVHPDTWSVRDEVAARAVSIAQAASLVVRSDGSMVAFHVGDTVRYAVRSPAGVWGADAIIDPGLDPKSAGPRAVVGAGDTVHLAYYGMDGTIWYRRLLSGGTLTPRQQIASGLGATRAEYGAVLPLVFIPRTNTVVILYRQSDGLLWERRILPEGPPTPPVRVTDRAVVQDAVDSQQPGADAVLDGETVHVLFIDESSRSIFSTNDRGGWQPSKREISGIQGSWVRGGVQVRGGRSRVLGYVYDAGSHGGAGMNRYADLELIAK